MSPVIRTIWTQQSEDQASDSHENGDDGEVSVLKLQYSKECVFLVSLKRWDDAVEVLDAIIEEDEANSSARKRKIAIFKAQGDRARTVAELNKYLKVFMSDQVNNHVGTCG